MKELKFVLNKGEKPRVKRNFEIKQNYINHSTSCTPRNCTTVIRFYGVGWPSRLTYIIVNPRHCKDIMLLQIKYVRFWEFFTKVHVCGHVTRFFCIIYTEYDVICYFSSKSLYAFKEYYDIKCIY